MVLSKTNIRVFIILFVLVGQTILCLDYIPVLDIAFSGLRVLCFGAVFVLFLRHPRMNVFDWLFVSFAMVMFVAIILNGNSHRLVQWSSIIMDISILLGVFDIYFRRIGKDLLRILSAIFSLFVYLNFVLLLIFPNGLWISDSGMGQYMIGGNYNQMAMPLLAAVVTNYMYCCMRGKWGWNSLIVTVVIISTALICGSMTTSVGLILLALFVPLSKFRVSRVGLIIFFIAVCVWHLFVVVMQTDITSKYLVYFIEEVLDKDLTFTYRTEVWSDAMELIASSPVIGYGSQGPDFYEEHLGFLTPHNMNFLVLIDGGAVLYTVVILMALVAVHNANENKCRGVNILQFASATCFLMQAFESYSYTLIFYLLILMYYSDVIADDKLYVYNTAPQYS